MLPPMYIAVPKVDIKPQLQSGHLGEFVNDLGWKFQAPIEFEHLEVPQVLNWSRTPEYSTNADVHKFVVLYNGKTTVYSIRVPMFYQYAAVDNIIVETIVKDICVHHKISSHEVINALKSHVKSFVADPEEISSPRSIRDMSAALPGVGGSAVCPELDDENPASLCRIGQSTVWSLIQHLNDDHEWSRERIADWLDRLHDEGKIDIEFKEPIKIGES